MSEGGPLIPRFAEISNAAAEAAKFAVPSEIHPDDYIFRYHLELQRDPDRDKWRAHVTEYYFQDGDRCASRVDRLIREYHPQAPSRRLRVLEFASNYGCVSRHLRKLHDRYDLFAADFHAPAAEFLRERLDVPAMVASMDPGAFDPGRKFDVAFALYFFSHTSPRTFGAWIASLHASLAQDGLLFFTTHGRAAYEDENCPVLDSAGYWFLPDSERRHLPTDDYGAMVPTPAYVMECIGQCPQAALVAFQEATWWGKHDLFVIRKTRTDFRPAPAPWSPPAPAPEIEPLRTEIICLERQASCDRAEAVVLRDAIATIRRSTSWRVTAPLRWIGRLLGAVWSVPHDRPRR